MDKLKRREFLSRVKDFAIVILAPLMTVKEAIASLFPTRTVEKKTFTEPIPISMMLWGNPNESLYNLSRFCEVRT